MPIFDRKRALGRLAFTAKMDSTVSFSAGVKGVSARLDTELSSPYYAFQITLFVSSKEQKTEISERDQ